MDRPGQRRGKVIQLWRVRLPTLVERIPRAAVKAEQARQAFALTSRACAEGGSSTQATLAALAREMASAAGGGCIVRPREADPVPGSGWSAVTSHVQREQRAALRDLNDREFSAFASAFSARVAQTRRAVFMPNVSTDLLRVWSGPAAWEYVDTFEPCSIIAVSLRNPDEVIGSIIQWRESPAPPFVEDDLVLAEHVAERLELVMREAPPRSA